MSLLDKIKALLKRSKAIQSEAEEEQIVPSNSSQIAQEALKSDYQSIQSDQKSIQSEDNTRATQSFQTSTNLATLLEEKEKELPTGIIIGYTSKTLKNIEEGILRLEKSLPDKEWLKAELNEYFTKVIESLKIALKAIDEHESRSNLRYESIESALNRIEEIALSLKESTQKEQIIREISEIRKNMPLSPRMQQILEMLKEKKEMSYEEIAQSIGISVSALRGLLSEMCRRTDMVERFEKDGKGWLRFKSP
ncbi:MAG: winged helix-turn-helix transcriptional regulator [Candidatus Aenigmatarchaeota archaeon]